MEINIQEILLKHNVSADRMFPTKYGNLNSAISEIITEVLKEAVKNAKYIDRGCYNRENQWISVMDLNPESITSTINKVKF